MKIRVHETVGLPHGFLTCGYWYFEKPNNKGTLHIEVIHFRSTRYFISVLGHELLEALWCKLTGVTTEICDEFDTWMEGEYLSGRIPETFEGGFHKDCPYRVGHRIGVIFEYVWIYGTFGNFKNYELACNAAMGIGQESDPR